MAIGTARSNLNLLYSIVKYVSETEKSAGSSLAELISVTDEELAIKDSDIIAEVHEYGSMTHSAFVYRAALDASAPNMTPLQICPDIISEVLQCVSMGANLAEWGPKTWMCSYSRWEVQQYLVAYTVAKLMADRLDIHLEKNETGNTAVEYPDCGRLLTDFSNSLNAVPARPFCRVWGFTAMYELFGERHMLFARYLDANSRDAKPENICVLDELRPCFELDSLCKDRYEVICNTTDSIRGMLLDIAAIECSRMCEDTIIMRLLTTKVVREAFNMMLSNPDSAFKDLKCSD
ncbi:hypothetical protein FBU30_004630 [Linnemannia zychae]|nr:hypothetical protein FBU30_004630 [Linnemannia zychae]